jgi:hypothetical protein
MVNSRDIKLLRDDVEANCQALLDICQKAGYDARLSCTYRDQEYQESLWKQGKAPRYVTFHGKGLAFDVFLQRGGIAIYDDTGFWNFISAHAKKMGFTWMYDLIGSDKPHFQWDDGRKYHNAEILANKLPPQMPLYKDEIKELVDDITKKYGLNSPDYWYNVMKGTQIVSKENIKELFKKFNNV